jgi:serine/threonine protein kinase
MHSVLGEGSFGCVVKPAVPCSGPVKRISKRGKSEVGKIFVDAEDFNKELQAAHVVSRIDPSGETILVPSEHCKTHVNEDIATSCDAFRKNHTREGYQLLMPYGGIRLDQYVADRGTISVKDFIILMLPVAEGIVKLEKHRYCHQDIKVANILVTPQHKAIIIDYSLMKPFKEIYKKTNYHYLHHTYFSYPPEYKSIYYKDSDSNTVTSEILKNIEIHDNGHFIKRFKKAWAATSKWIYNDVKQLEKYVNRVDVYSLGTVFVRLSPFIAEKSGRYRTAFDALVDDMIAINPAKRTTPQKLVDDMKNIIDM